MSSAFLDLWMEVKSIHLTLSLGGGLSIIQIGHQVPKSRSSGCSTEGEVIADHQPHTETNFYSIGRDNIYYSGTLGVFGAIRAYSKDFCTDTRSICHPYGF